MELCFQKVCKHRPCHIEKHYYAFSIHFSFFTYYKDEQDKFIEKYHCGISQ